MLRFFYAADHDERFLYAVERVLLLCTLQPRQKFHYDLIQNFVKTLSLLGVLYIFLCHRSTYFVLNVHLHSIIVFLNGNVIIPKCYLCLINLFPFRLPLSHLAL